MSIKSKWNWSKETNHEYKTKEYIATRKIVLNRDLGCCVRCWTLREELVPTNTCDHLIALSLTDKADHSLSNCWLLCYQCHAIKTVRESNNIQDIKKPFGNADMDDDRWQLNIDWQAVIKERNRVYLGITS